MSLTSQSTPEISLRQWNRDFGVPRNIFTVSFIYPGTLRHSHWFVIGFGQYRSHQLEIEVTGNAGNEYTVQCEVPPKHLAIAPGNPNQRTVPVFLIIGEYDQDRYSTLVTHFTYADLPVSPLGAGSNNELPIRQAKMTQDFPNGSAPVAPTPPLSSERRNSHPFGRIGPRMMNTPPFQSMVPIPQAEELQRQPSSIQPMEPAIKEETADRNQNDSTFAPYSDAQQQYGVSTSVSTISGSYLPIFNAGAPQVRVHGMYPPTYGRYLPARGPSQYGYESLSSPTNAPSPQYHASFDSQGAHGSSGYSYIIPSNDHYGYYDGARSNGLPGATAQWGAYYGGVDSISGTTQGNNSAISDQSYHIYDRTRPISQRPDMRPRQQVPTARLSQRPQLVRTTALSQAASSLGAMNSGGVRRSPMGPDGESVPYQASLLIVGDLDSIPVYPSWTTDEEQEMRRLVSFTREQDGPQLTVQFSVLPLAEYTPATPCISCIYWEAKKQYFVTSVDCIFLLEQLVATKFSVEEKNRIRRNLEGYRPLTVSKGRADCNDFFRLIMSYDNPKPRNIEKDVKVFPWSILSHALQKIIGKYSADYSTSSDGRGQLSQ